MTVSADLPDTLKQRLLSAARGRLDAASMQHLEAAAHLAEAAHRGQERKHGGPYVFHPIRVAWMLLEEFAERDGNLLAAALLHDVLEDAPERVSAADISAACGHAVLELVEALTSPPESVVPDKSKRNRLKAQKVLAASKDAWYIKLADRIDNLRDALALSGIEGRRFRNRYLGDTVQYYLPMVLQLDNARVARAFNISLSTLKEKVMAEAVTPQIVDRAGVELDVRRMQLPHNLDQRYGPLLNGAVEQMQQVERGEIVNVDEGWQVGHYWLRNAELAPPQYRQEIQAALASIGAFYETNFKDRFANILWIGIGGSGLGPRMLYDVLRVPGKTLSMFFFDNTDPSGFRRTLDEIEHSGGLAKTLTVVVSKSGGTAETANGMKVARHEYENHKQEPLKFEEHAVAITKPGSKLDKLAEPWLARFPIWDYVGGRTSLFSSVGMLPARLLRFDGAALQAGAKEMDNATRDRNLDENPALLLAATWYHTVETLGRRNMVVLPYCDRLELLSKYLQQLVMESLGKSGKGITVFGNKGSTDQHSFVQQLREGYPDFFVTFIRVVKPDADWKIDGDLTAADYLAAFQEGTAQALREAGRPSLRISIDQLDAKALGSLIALFERAVGYYAAMLGINAYHQPGVEAGKKAAVAVVEAQSNITAVLASRPNDAMTVSDIAVEAKEGKEAVFNTLDRLARCGDRLIVRKADAADGIPQFAYCPK